VYRWANCAHEVYVLMCDMTTSVGDIIVSAASGLLRTGMLRTSLVCQFVLPIVSNLFLYS
jgi:hypothetical protein